MLVFPGLRKLISSKIQQLFNTASFDAPLTHSLVLERGTGSPTFTRASTATVTNNDGYLVTALAGEARFVGARRVRNLQATSSEPTSGWTAAGATPPTVTYTTLDGSGAVSMAFPVVAAGYANSRCSGPVNSVSWVQNSTKIATQMVVSLSRALTGSEALTLYLAGASALDDVIVFNASNSPTSAVLQSVVDTFVNPTFSGTMGVMVYVSGAIVGSPVTLSLTRIQVEDVTAQTTQTAGEYVSVGVESAPYYHGSMVDGVKCFPTDLSGNPIPSTTMLGYQAQGARTNLCLQSNAFTTTWTNSPALSTLSQNVIGPDGAVSAWTCADTDAANTSRLYQSITLTAAAYTASLFVKKTSGATSFPVIALVTGTVYGLATLDTNNGVATAWTANGYGTTLSGVSARCSSFDSDFWRFELTATGTAAAYTYQLYPAGTTNATQSTGVLDQSAQGSAVFYGAQVELGSFASSYIATTTIAVTRNADVLIYSSAGNIDGTKGWCYAEFDVSNDSDGNQNIIIGSDVAGVFPLYAQPSLGNVRTLDGTNAPIAQSAPMTGVRKGAGTWGGSTLQNAHNGVVSSTTAFDGDMEVTAVIRVGEDNAGNSHFFGNIKNVRIGQRQLSASELQAITR